MLKKESLKKFHKELKKLRIYAKESNISDIEVDEIFKNGLMLLKESETALPNNVKSNKTKTIISFTKYFLVISLIVILFYILLTVHQPTSSIVLRNVQGLIHPGFKFLRLFSVPIIKMFPLLTSNELITIMLS